MDSGSAGGTLVRRDAGPEVDAALGSLPMELLTLVAGALPQENLPSCRLVSRSLKLAGEGACTRLAPCAAVPYEPRQALPMSLLARMASLAELDLSGCTAVLTDGSLRELISCVSATLERLTLDGCFVSEKGLTGLTECTRLAFLSLARCSRVSNSIVPDTLTKCLTLETLILRECRQISDRGAVALAHHPSLTQLDLSCCYGIGGKGVSALRGLCRLKGLQMAGLDRFGDDSLQDLRALTGISELNLQACWQITNEGVAALAELSSLKELSLAEGCETVSDEGLGSLTRLVQLENLNLSYSCWDVSSEGLSCLSTMTQLTALNLCGCYAVNDAVLHAVSGLRLLVSLNVSECEPITDQGVTSLTALTRLESLDMCWAFQVTDASIIEISNSLTNLTSLRLSRCQRVSDQGVIALGKLRRLQLLHLNKIHLLTDRALEILAPQLPGIRELDIGRCHKITGETLRYVAAAMPSLADLNLVGCQGITAAGLHHLVKLPELQALDVSGMPHVAACGLSALPDLPALRTLRMAGDGYLRPIQVVLNSPVPRLPELCSLDFSGADVLPPGSQANLSTMSPRMLRTPLQSAIAATRHGWMRRSRPQKGMKALPGLQAMLAELPSLRQLRISNMRDVPQAAVSDLSARYPKLTIVRVDS